MKALLWPFRALFLAGFALVVLAVWTCDAIREARLKRKLGPLYEGPLDNKEL